MREAKVRKGVFVAAVDASVTGQRRKLGERIEHLRRGTFEQPSAAAGEKRIAAENHRAAGNLSKAGNVARGMPGYLEHCQDDFDSGYRNRIAFNQRSGNTRDRLVRRP